eukprot:GDKI01013418.1.p1 GENE.GDKI01013418.1~~GDKI01013418.1.p1  ORF type:complete len:188 (+),score=60.08 GDKI01013418.1:42-566(+)
MLNVHCAVCDRPGSVHWKDGGPMGGMPEMMSSAFLWDFHRELVDKDGNLNWDAVNQLPEVMCVPLSDLLQRLDLTHIDAMILDVEGGELKVLQVMDWNKIRIDVIAVETEPVQVLHRPPNYAKDVREFMESVGYLHVRDDTAGRNSWFMRPDFIPHTHPTPLEPIYFDFNATHA